jgi:hypothetical protein
MIALQRFANRAGTQAGSCRKNGVTFGFQDILSRWPYLNSDVSLQSSETSENFMHARNMPLPALPC